jgi:hypothetical protein
MHLITRSSGALPANFLSAARLTMPSAAAFGQSSTPSNQGQITFTKDVAPIFQRSCQNCHRPGAIAPMSLLTYQEARPGARSIKEKIIKREMPPWYIDRNVGITKFKDDPALSNAEIATITRWVDSGAPGTYHLRATANDGALSKTTDVIVTVR